MNWGERGSSKNLETEIEIGWWGPSLSTSPFLHPLPLHTYTSPLLATPWWRVVHPGVEWCAHPGVEDWAHQRVEGWTTPGMDGEPTLYPLHPSTLPFSTPLDLLSGGWSTRSGGVGPFRGVEGLTTPEDEEWWSGHIRSGEVNPPRSGGLDSFGGGGMDPSGGGRVEG